MNAGKQAKDESAILALACGASVETAAQKAGISKRTLQRRMADPEFRRQIQAIRSDMVERHSGTLTAAGTEAIKTLLELLKPTNAGTVRLGAARSVLEIAGKYREMADLDERVATNRGPMEVKVISDEERRQVILAILEGTDFLQPNESVEIGSIDKINEWIDESETPASSDAEEVIPLVDRN